MTDTTYYKTQIMREDQDPLHVENDLKIILLAIHKRFEDDGWDQLQNRCYTQASKSIINSIEMRKYHAAEYRLGMM